MCACMCEHVCVQTCVCVLGLKVYMHQSLAAFARTVLGVQAAPHLLYILK